MLFMTIFFRQRWEWGYENSDAISDHILSSLVGGEEGGGGEDVTAQARSEQESVPHSHMNWLNPT